MKYTRCFLFFFKLMFYPSLTAESRDCFTENRIQVRTSESTIGTRTSSTVNEDKAQWKFCAKSYLPARINSTALESISVLFQCRISHAQAYEKVHKYGNHMPACSDVLCVCSLLDFLSLIIDWAIRLARLPPGLNSYCVSHLFFFLLSNPSLILHFLMPCTAFQLLTHTKGGFLWVHYPLRYF